jgi:hypothetical protein
MVVEEEESVKQQSENISPSKELIFYLMYYAALRQRSFKVSVESLNTYVHFYLYNDFNFYFSTKSYDFSDNFIKLLIKLCKKN